MNDQITLDADAIVKDASRDQPAREVLADVAMRRLAIVNVALIGARGAGDRGWVLIDAGLPGTAGLIAGAAEQRFGPGARPAAIVMTHGHFDHVGVLETLAEQWDAPVYAHELELPYLNGQAAYPPPDPTVGGGMMSLLSPLFPRSPVNVGSRLRALPEDGSVPAMPGWRWIHTPGHAPGHVSFWREADRTLLSGDAFISTRQESAYAAATQEPELHGPPMYFTVDWQASRRSVETLAALEPEVVVTGHGLPLHGGEMRAALHRLAAEFDRVAVPANGRYVNHPARAEDGSAYQAPG